MHTLPSAPPHPPPTIIFTTRILRWGRASHASPVTCEPPGGWGGVGGRGGEALAGRLFSSWHPHHTRTSPPITPPPPTPPTPPTPPHTHTHAPHQSFQAVPQRLCHVGSPLGIKPSGHALLQGGGGGAMPGAGVGSRGGQEGRAGGCGEGANARAHPSQRPPPPPPPRPPCPLNLPGTAPPAAPGAETGLPARAGARGRPRCSAEQRGERGCGWWVVGAGGRRVGGWVGLRVGARAGGGVSTSESPPPPPPDPPQPPLLVTPGARNGVKRVAHRLQRGFDVVTASARRATQPAQQRCERGWVGGEGGSGCVGGAGRGGAWGEGRREGGASGRRSPPARPRRLQNSSSAARSRLAAALLEQKPCCRKLWRGWGGGEGRQVGRPWQRRRPPPTHPPPAQARTHLRTTRAEYSATVTDAAPGGARAAPLPAMPARWCARWGAPVSGGCAGARGGGGGGENLPVDEGPGGRHERRWARPHAHRACPTCTSPPCTQHPPQQLQHCASPYGGSSCVRARRVGGWAGSGWGAPPDLVGTPLAPLRCKCCCWQWHGCCSDKLGAAAASAQRASRQPVCRRTRRRSLPAPLHRSRPPPSPLSHAPAPPPGRGRRAGPSRSPGRARGAGHPREAAPPTQRSAWAWRPPAPAAAAPHLGALV